MVPDFLLLVSLRPWAAWAAWRAWAAWAASAAWVAWAAGKLKFAILWFDLSLEASKMQYCRSLFVAYVQKCDTVDLESGHVFTTFHICDTVVLDSH